MMYAQYLWICLFVVCGVSAMDEMHRPMSAVDIHARQVELDRLGRELQQAHARGERQKVEYLQSQITSYKAEFDNLQASHHEKVHMCE